LPEIDALVFAELVDHPNHNALIIVVTAEVGVTICSFDFDHTITDFED
jgi:hypothetical protein